MIKSKWIHNNKIFPCQATPCGCESCSNRQIRQHRFRRRHHAWSSATKKGFWICPREKNTQVFPKKTPDLVCLLYHNLGYWGWRLLTRRNVWRFSLTSRNRRSCLLLIPNRSQFKKDGGSTMPSTVASPTPAMRSLFPRVWWKSGGMLTETPPRSYCLNLSNLVYLNLLKLCVRDSWIWSNLDLHHQCYLRFEFLKCFLVDPSFQSMHIETWFKESKS